MISIIVPIYNSEKWLRRCVDSLLCQTYPDIQILLINDGSKDDSLAICNEYADRDSRVQVINKKNSGVSDTRNMGLDHATGEYVLFVDSDDHIEADACEKFLGAIDGCDLALCGMRIWRNGKILRQPHLPAGRIDLCGSIDTYFQLRKINLGPCNKLYIRQKIDHRFRSGLSLGEDTLFVFEYLRKVRHVGVLSDCLYNVVLDNENSLNKKKFDNKLDVLLEQRQEEEELLHEIYGPQADLTSLYDQILLTVHTVMLDMDELKISFIKKYTSNAALTERINGSRPVRWDYVLLRKLFLIKSNRLILLYFQLKRIILKILKR